MQAGRRAGAGATGPGGPRRVGAGSFRRIDPLYEVARLVPAALQEGLRVHPSRPALEQKTAVGALHRVLPRVDPPGTTPATAADDAAPPWSDGQQLGQPG